MNKDEWKLAWNDAQRKGVGVYDMAHKLRIDPEDLAFIRSDGKRVKAKPRSEIELRADLVAVQRIYRDKFGDQSPYELELFVNDPGMFVERMIRAVEICTLNFVLNTGDGSLNKNNSTITKAAASSCGKTAISKGQRRRTDDLRRHPDQRPTDHGPKL